MFERIVISLDGSELAEVALPYSEEIMRRLNSVLVLLSVCNPEEKQERQEYLDQVVERIRQRAAKYRDRYSDVYLYDPVVETAIIDGSASEGIIDYVEQNNLDLTMMATHGRSGISRWAMGSVADKVVRGLAKPVCLIRARGSHADVRPDCLVSRIFAPLDGSGEGEAALPYIESFAKRMNTEVVLFQSVSKDGQPDETDWVEAKKMAERHAKIYLRKVEANLIYRNITVRTMVKFGGNPSTEIIELAEKTQSAVVAMSTHGRSGVDRMVFGSVAEKVLRAGTTPLLLVRTPGAEMPHNPSYGSSCSINI